MKFIVQAKEFQRLLEFSSLTINKESPIPALSCYEIMCHDDILRVRGTNIDSTSVIQLDNVDVKSPGTILANASKLLSVVQLLSGELEVSFKDEKIVIKSARSRNRLVTLPASEYPVEQVMVNTRKLTVSKSCLARAFDMVSFAADKTEVGKFRGLHGILFTVNDTHLRMSATDGFIVSTMGINVDPDEENEGFSGEYIVPVHVSRLVKHLDGKIVTCRFGTDGDSVMVEMCGENTVIRAQLINATFPNLSDLRNNKYRHVMVFNNNDLQVSINQMLAITENDRALFTIAKDTCSLYTEEPERGWTSKEIPVENRDGVSFAFKFNVRWMKKIITASNLIGPQTAIVVTDPEKPFRVFNPADQSWELYAMPISI